MKKVMHTDASNTAGSRNGQETALVSGAGRGIGLAISQRLCEDGYYVIRVDADQNTLADSSALLRDQGFGTTDICLDVADEQQVLSMLDTVAEHLDTLTCLVNNAAISPRDEQGGKIPVLKLPLDTWERTLAVNLTGTFLMCRTLIPFMAARGYGRIINISSLGGRTALGDLTTSAYGVSKAGLIGFTRILAREVASQGITVNVICPGRIATNMAAVADPAANADYLKRTPIGRSGTPDEVADMVAYLTGVKAGFVTGACLDINGGLWMG